MTRLEAPVSNYSLTYASGVKTELSKKLHLVEVEPMAGNTAFSTVATSQLRPRICLPVAGRGSPVGVGSGAVLVPTT